MFCTTCGGTMQDGLCVNCGVKPVVTAAEYPLVAITQNDVGLRIGDYLLDVIPALVVSLVVGWIPIVGAVFAGIFLLVYWLVRDIGGASLGKLILGLKVVMKDGSPSTIAARMLRNLPIAIGPALLIIPLAGYFIAPPVAFILILVEAILLITRKERMGDMLAGTTVVRKIPVVYTPTL